MASCAPVTCIVLAAVFVTALYGEGVWAQAPSSAPLLAPSSSAPEMGPAAAMAPLPDCFTSLVNLSDCLTYVEKGSNLTVPEKPCCPELAGLVESNPICLCQLLGNTTASFGVTLDVNKALKLPSVCNVTTPPASLCSAVGVPVGVPTPSGASLSPGVHPPAGFEASPTTGKKDNGASSITNSAVAYLVGLAISFFLTLF